MLLEDNVELSYSNENKIFTLQFLNRAGAGRNKRVVSLETLKCLQIFRDHSALEIFINEGEAVFSTRYYPEQENRIITVQCQAADIMMWELGEMSYGKK